MFVLNRIHFSYWIQIWQQESESWKLLKKLEIVACRLQLTPAWREIKCWQLRCGVIGVFVKERLVNLLVHGSPLVWVADSVISTLEFEVDIVLSYPCFFKYILGSSCTPVFLKELQMNQHPNNTSILHR